MRNKKDPNMLIMLWRKWKFWEACN